MIHCLPLRLGTSVADPPPEAKPFPPGFSLRLIFKPGVKMMSLAAHECCNSKVDKEPNNEGR